MKMKAPAWQVLQMRQDQFVLNLAALVKQQAAAAAQESGKAQDYERFLFSFGMNLLFCLRSRLRVMPLESEKIPTGKFVAEVLRQIRSFVGERVPQEVAFLVSRLIWQLTGDMFTGVEDEYHQAQKSNMQAAFGVPADTDLVEYDPAESLRDVEVGGPQ